MSLERLIHDANAALRARVQGPVTRCEVPPAAHAAGTFPVQASGELVLDNTFEARVLPGRPAATAFSWDAAQGHHLRDVLLAGTAGHVFFPDGTVLAACLRGSREPARKIRRPLARLARRIEQPLIHLAGPNPENIGHFVFDHLPRLLPLVPVLRGRQDVKVLLSGPPRPWHREFLGPFGIQPDQLIQQGPGTLAVADCHYVPIPVGVGKLGAPAAYLALRQRFVDPQTPTEGGRPLFISRADVADKRILNEPAVLAATRQVLGEVEVVNFRGLSLAAQVALFRRAPVVVGAVGQGLTNLLFAENKLHIILSPETQFRERSWGRGYHNLSRLAGNHTVCLLADSPCDAQRNWTVDIPRFTGVLARAWDLFRRHPTRPPTAP